MAVRSDSNSNSVVSVTMCFNFPIDQFYRVPDQLRVPFIDRLCVTEKEREREANERTETLRCTCSQVHVRTFHPRARATHLSSFRLLSRLSHLRSLSFSRLARAFFLRSRRLILKLSANHCENVNRGEPIDDYVGP